MLMCIPVEMEMVSSVSRVVSEGVGLEVRASVQSCSNPRTTMRDLQIVSFSRCTHLEDKIFPLACSIRAVSYTSNESIEVASVSIPCSTSS